MNNSALHLSNAPIIEAIVDIDCDLPPGFCLADHEEAARTLYRTEYPRFRPQFIAEHEIRHPLQDGAPPQVSARTGLQAFQFFSEDERQLVQVRSQGYSFNRLAPYSTLDDYLPEIERTWQCYRELTTPLQIRVVRLQFINRILLPAAGENLNLDRFLRLAPRLPDEDLVFAGFLNHHVVIEKGTSNEATIILNSQPFENGRLPIIFHIEARRQGPADSADWTWIQETLGSLRTLKNRIFRNTLTDECLSLFQ